MINITAEINSGKSIGNINIGDKVDIVLSQNNYKRIVSNKFSEEFTEYIVEDDCISFVGNNNSNEIVNVCCFGEYLGKYKNLIGPNSTVKELMFWLDDSTISHLTVLHGFILLDKDFRIGFSLPNEFEESDFIEELPKDLILERLYVMKKDWWR